MSNVPRRGTRIAHLGVAVRAFDELLPVLYPFLQFPPPNNGAAVVVILLFQL